MRTNHEASRHELEATQSVDYQIKSQEVLIYLDLSPCFEEIKIIIYAGIIKDSPCNLVV